MILATPLELDLNPRGCLHSRSVIGHPGAEYFVYVPRRIDPRAPLLVGVHGISLNAREHIELFAPHAERRGIVLVAPVFSPGIFPGFQRPGRRRSRPDLCLDRIVDDVCRAAGPGSARFALFGFSGGGQFAHRYALFRPRRVRSLILAAPGWYTFPDLGARYPLGLAANPRYPRARCRLESFLRIPVRIVVGERDVERDGSLNTTPEIDAMQGTTRVERARRYVEALRGAARERGLVPAVSLTLLPGTGHSFRECMLKGGLAEIVFEALY